MVSTSGEQACTPETLLVPFPMGQTVVRLEPAVLHSTSLGKQFYRSNYP
jgi:hypothetical protein